MSRNATLVLLLTLSALLYLVFANGNGEPVEITVDREGTA